MSHALIGLLRGLDGQNRTEITKLFVDVLWSFESLRHLFAQQGAIPLSQLVHKALHRSLGYTEAFGELCIRNILPFRGQAVA
jgi:hypothetical protein